MENLKQDFDGRDFYLWPGTDETFSLWPPVYDRKGEEVFKAMNESQETVEWESKHVNKVRKERV